MKIRQLFAVCLIMSLFYSVQIISPIQKELGQNDEIFLGAIGPGQTLYVEANPWIMENGEYKAHYDMMLTTELPYGWKSTKSKLYEDPLQITITSSEFEKEGTYPIWISIEDEDNAENVEDVEFIGKIEIKYDIMEMDVEPKKISTGAGQPARYYITVTNKGIASDVFEVSAENVEKWNFKKYVYIPASSSKTIVYEIVENEEESFYPKIIVKSTSSSIIKKEVDLELQVQTDLWNDFKAVNHGTGIFPILEEPIFAFMGLLSNLW